MLERHVIHQNRGFGGCSIEIFTLESWIINSFRVIGHVNYETHNRERKYARDDSREICVTPYTNTNTNTTCEAFFPVAR